MKIKELREQKGLSQNAIAKELGVAQSTYSDWERERTIPSLSDLEMLAKYFDVSLDEICGREIKLPTPAIKTPKVFHGGYSFSQYELTATVDEIEDSIRQDLEDIKQSFFQIGYKLSIIQTNRLYLDYGFDSIIDYAESRFNIGKTTTYNLISIYDRFRSYDKGTIKISKEFNDYSYSQLVAIDGCKHSIFGIEKYISKNDSVSDIEKFIKIWNKSYQKTGSAPIGKDLKDVLERYEEKPKIEMNPLPLGVVPGQQSLDLDALDYEYVQGGGIDYEPEEEPKTELTPFAKMFIEEKPAVEKHKFKNDREREEFIRSALYKKVLTSEELGLEVERLDFANGACVYRSITKEYIEWKGEYITCVRYHLVDKNANKKPPVTACCTNYSLKTYTMDGTSMGYIIKYMAMYKDEI